MSDWTTVSGITVLTLVVVLSFAIDRVVAATMFLLSFSGAWGRKFPEPTLIKSRAERFHAERSRKLIYFAFASILAVLVLLVADQVRVLTALGFKSIHRTQTSGNVSTLPGTSPSPSPSPSPGVAGAPSATETDRSFAMLDFLITALILVGGADRLEALFRGTGAGSGDRNETDSKPLEIKGTIRLDDETKNEKGES